MKEDLGHTFNTEFRISLYNPDFIFTALRVLFLLKCACIFCFPHYFKENTKNDAVVTLHQNTIKTK